MPEARLALPPRGAVEQHLLIALKRYWPLGSGALRELPVSAKSINHCSIPLRLASVRLPEWAAACGVDGAILVPQEASSVDDSWQQVDWWLAAFLMLEGWHERLWEEWHGPIHSYSFRLNGWDERVWQHAWVNRIALFLRVWAAKIANTRADELLGPLPKPEFLMTHDVDAVEKTFSIRFKQGAFNLINAFRGLMRGDFQKTSFHVSKSCCFLFGREDWWTLDNLLDIENDYKLCTRYHFFADKRTKSIKRWLFDPGYDISSLQIRTFILRLKTAGAEVGLHPSFDSWQDAEKIHKQKKNLESEAGLSCNSVRQHWLRFSWRNTWAAQEEAGIREDTTLMFNDRPGFRNSAAISWCPWQPAKKAAGHLLALPTLIMDSHFYDYSSMTDDARCQDMGSWIQECRAVSGQSAVLWHPHTLTNDYGWSQGFHELASMIASTH